MARNIFSGIFGGGGSDGSASMKLARYNQQLDDYQYEKEGYEQGRAVEAMAPGIAAVMENLSPQRREQVKLQQMMMSQQPMFTKAMEGFNKNLAQSGDRYDYIDNQETQTEQANARHQYEVDHAKPGDVGARLEYARAYEALTPEQRITWDRAARARQLVDKGTHWEDIGTGERYDKNKLQSEVETAAGKDIGGFLVDYEASNASSNKLADKFSLQLESLSELEDSASGWTTGLGAYMAALPATEARDYQNKLDAVNARTVVNTMMDLKAASSSGATGFGAVNLKELETMQDQWGKIDPLASKEQNLAVIKKRKELVKTFITNVRRRQKLADAKYINNQDRIPASMRTATPTIQTQQRNPTTPAASGGTSPQAVGHWDAEQGKVVFD